MTIPRASPSGVYDSYWRFAAERHSVYLKRIDGIPAPWTSDPILRSFRFTNPYRATDRVSQYLIGMVQYREDRSQSSDELFFRTMLFKLFNRVWTWEWLERHLGPLTWQSVDLDEVDRLLEEAMRRGHRIYSAAYIMPAPSFGQARKHSNHLALLRSMMDDGVPSLIERSVHLSDVYQALLSYPGLGPFLAFQYTIDLNYSRMLEFSEQDFVVAGPGALDGISKCFADVAGMSPEDVIFEMVDIQEAEFARLGLAFDGLFGRRLHPIDCQNLFCEISKYARVAHPEARGLSARTRIKQSYRPDDRPLSLPVFPPKWGLRVSAANSPVRQPELWAD